MNSSKENEYIFETVDPLSNYIYLTSERWNEHIVIKHVEMYGEEDIVQKTIENPDAIYPDKDFPTTHNYFLKHEDLILNTYGSHVKVIVNRELQGQVISAYCTPKSKKILNQFI